MCTVSGQYAETGCIDVAMQLETVSDTKQAGKF